MTIGGVVGRLAAVVVAILLIVGALAWRDARQSADGPSPDPSGAPTTQEPDALGEILCAAELRFCDDLELGGALADVPIRTVDGVTTASELSTGNDAPIWITLRSLTDVVASARDLGGEAPLLDRSDALAVSPLVMVVWNDRAAVLERACDTVGWACVGRIAEEVWEDAGGEAAWGVVKPAHPAPDRSGIGLLVLAQASADQLGTADYSSRDLDTLEYERWFTSLESAVPTFRPTGGSHVQQMLQFGPASLDLTGTTEAEAAELLDRAGTRGSNLVVLSPPPTVVAEVVIATPRGVAPPAGLAEAVRQALVDSGWRTSLDTAPSLLPDAPTPGEPVTFRGGILEALQLRWDRVR